MVDYLKINSITTVAIEFTVIYWHLYLLLLQEERFEAILARETFTEKLVSYFESNKEI